MILVDSSVWIDYFRGTATPQTEKLDGLLESEPLAIGDLILTLTSLIVVDLGGQETAIQAARNFRVLREHGIAVRKTIHSIIATRCIESDYDLLHNDRSIDPFVKYLGLRAVN